MLIYVLPTPPNLPLCWYFLPSNSCDKGEELKASLSSALRLFASRLLASRICSLAIKLFNLETIQLG